MAAVIRRPRLGTEPLLLRTGAVVPASPVLAAGPGVATAAPAMDLEAEVQRRLHTERVSWQQQLANSARQAGRDEGLAAGHAEGLAAGRAEWAARIAQLDELLAGLHQQLAAGIAGHEDLLVELAFEAVLRILGEAAPTRAGVLAIVRGALQTLPEREGLVVRLAPHDAAAVEALRDELPRLAGTRGLELVADDRIELGGCLIETAGGGLDARLETQVQRLRELLLAARQQEGAE